MSQVFSQERFSIIQWCNDETRNLHPLVHTLLLQTTPGFDLITCTPSSFLQLRWNCSRNHTHSLGLYLSCFVGCHELCSGKRIVSAFVLHEQRWNVMRALCISLSTFRNSWKFVERLIGLRHGLRHVPRHGSKSGFGQICCFVCRGQASGQVALIIERWCNACTS